MNKKNFKLIVTDFTTSKIDWQIEAYQEDGTEIGVEAYIITNDGSDGYMVDEHISSQYPELEKLGLLDEVEGFMIYEGELNTTELISELKKLGFNAE